jgi:hypothetical protein
MSKKHKKAHRRGERGMQGGQGAGGPMYQGQYGHYGQYGMGGMGADPAAGMYAAETAFAQGAGAGYGPGAGAWPSGLQAGLQAGLGPTGLDGGLLQGMPAFLRTRNSEQFLLGALIGAAAAWVLSDEELRAKIVKSAMKLYAGVAGGFEEMKEQMADLRAEVEAEQHGDA